MLALVCMWLVAGCGRCGLQDDPGVKVVVPTMPTTMDWSTSDETTWMNYNVVLATEKGLTQVMPDGTVGPAIAKSWRVERLGDGRERYVFELRTDVRWSDGVTPVTARDFVVGWKRAMVGKERGALDEVAGAARVTELLAKGVTGAELAAALNEVGVRELDEHTLEVLLDSPRSYFLARIAVVYLFFPVPARALEGLSERDAREYFDRPREGHPMAIGPFRVSEWDRAGERVTLVRNPNSAFAPVLAEGEKPVERITLLKSEVGAALFERHRVGFMTIDTAAAFRQMKLDDAERSELFSVYFAAFNTRRPPLDDPEVRRALSMAIDREAVMKGLLPAARLARGLLPPGLPYSGDEETRARLPTYDPEAAKRILAAHPVTRPLRLLYRSTESFVPEVAIAERIKAQLAQVGVPVEVEARYDFSQEIRRIAPDGFESHDLYLRRIGGDYAHPNTFFELFQRGGNHRTGWDTIDGGAAMNRFMEELAAGDRAETDPTSHYVAAERMLVDELTVVAPIYYPDRYFRRQPELAGLGLDRFNFLQLATVRQKQ